MENHESLDRWVNACVAGLDPAAGWRPDTARGFGRLRRRQRTVRRRRWGLGIAAAVLASSLFVIPGCQAATCKMKSDNLAEQLWKSVFAPPPPGP
jgi:hypothetical protein